MVRGKDYIWGHKTKARSVPRENITDKPVAPAQRAQPVNVLELTDDELDRALMRVLKGAAPATKIAVLRDLLRTMPT